MTDVLKNIRKFTHANGDLKVALNMPDGKKCQNCGCLKEFTQFRLNVKCNHGLHSWCQRCERKYHRGYYSNVTKLTAVK